MEQRNFFVHESSYVDEPCAIGAGTKVWHFSHIMKNSRIGANCNIGQNVVISPEVVIGNNVKIQNNVSVYTGCVLEDDVFCGPSMVFTNVTNPRSHIIRKNEYKTTLVRKGASLGANCTVVCGTVIGQYAFVGAGSVVTRDVPDYALVYGNPARQRGWMCACGIALEFGCEGDQVRSKCTACGAEYMKSGQQITPAGAYRRGERIVIGATEKQIPLLNLRAQHQQIREEVLKEIVRVVDSQKFILGEDVQKLETEVASYCGTKYAVGCASGSDALFLALMAFDIGPGDEVLTSPYTFFATAGAISRIGAEPVFVDVEEHTFNLDANRVQDVLASHPKIRAIIPVHLFGGCADLDPICALANQRGIAVIEDAAQAIGSEYKGLRAGRIGQVGAFSFFPSKNLGGYGDGGMLTTNDKSLAERLAALRIHGRTGKYFHQWIGINSRLDALQAAVLRVKLRYLDGWTAGRQKNAERYRAGLAKLSVPVRPPLPASYQTRHVYNQFVIRCQDRDALQSYLKERGIGSEVYYPLPLHLQPCFAGLGYKKGDFPVSEKLAVESLALPIQSELAAEDLDHVCDSIRSFYAKTCGSAQS